MKITGQSSFGTGDINLAAALLSIGIEPCAAEPVRLIACESGADYVRFHLEPQSPDGLYLTCDMMSAWDDPAGFKATFPAHPFALLMTFISARPRGCSNSDEWIRHAAAFLGLTLNAVWKTFRTIGQVCAASPESPVSYVVAFVKNRCDLITEAKRRERAGEFSTWQTHGRACGMIPAKAPAKIRKYLLDSLHQ